MISKVSFKPLKGPTVDVPFSDEHFTLRKGAEREGATDTVTYMHY